MPAIKYVSFKDKTGGYLKERQNIGTSWTYQDAIDWYKTQPGYPEGSERSFTQGGQKADYSQIIDDEYNTLYQIDVTPPTPSNPTISQVFIDGVTYDLKDKNAGGLPEGGTTGQVLTKTDDGAGWQDPSGGSNLDVMIQDDYDNLSETEKMDGTFRFIYIEQES